MGLVRLSGFVTILKLSGAGCSNEISDSSRAPAPLAAREAVTLSFFAAQVCTSVAPSRFSIVILLSESLNTRAKTASSLIEEDAATEKKDSDIARIIALIMALTMSSALPEPETLL